MASADITSKDTSVKGVNSPTNYIRSEAHLIDGVENPGILAADTHSLFVIPKGNAIVGLKVVALSDTTSAGSATVTFKVKVGTETATAVGSAIAKANLAAGFVHNLAVATLAYGSGSSDDITIQMTVGTAALTAAKLLVIVDTVPVEMFMTAG